MSASPVTVEVAFLKATSEAILIEFDEIETWLPRSQIEYDGLLDHCQRGELVELTIPHWLACARGLI